MNCNHDKRFTDTGDEGTSHCVYCRALAAEKEIERITVTIIDRLPTTKDRVPVTPGMRLWLKHPEAGKVISWFAAFYQKAHTILSVEDSDDFWSVEFCEAYSTREAAEAAGGCDAISTE